jgi:8-oxo-dGTP pyrophosphatase MutT (NUDIX family)
MSPDDLRARLIHAAHADGPPSSDHDLNLGVDLPEGRTLRPAGVLVGITERAGVPHVILTKRSSRLKHHPGQIAFPGGKVEDTDTGPEDAALREANEEVGLPRDIAEVLGTLPPHETVTSFTVTPVLCWIRDTFDPVLDLNEVDEVFEIPLKDLIDPAKFVVQSRHWRGSKRSYYAVPWGPYYVWGATARILRGLSDRLNA